MSELKPSWWDDTKYGDLSGVERNRQVERDKLLWEQNQKLEMQNQLELEKLKLEKEQVEADRENAKLIAEATRQAERDRHYNEMILEEERQMHDLNVELSRQEHEEKMRCKKLCDKLDIDYEELLEFDSKFNYGIVSYDELFLKKYDIKTMKRNFERYKRKNYMSDDTENTVDFDENDIRTYDIMDIQDRIEEEKDRINQVSNIKYSPLQIIIDLPLICWVFAEFLIWFSIGNGLALFILSIVVFIVFNFICKVNIKSKTSNIVKTSNEKIKEFEAEINRRNTLAKKQHEAQIKKFENEIKELEKSIEKDEKANDEYAKKLYAEFINFRIEHYNEKIENLFSKIHLDNIKTLDRIYEKNNKSIEELKTGEGTVKDYMNYIRKVLR